MLNVDIAGVVRKGQTTFGMETVSGEGCVEDGVGGVGKGGYVVGMETLKPNFGEKWRLNDSCSIFLFSSFSFFRPQNRYNSIHIVIFYETFVDQLTVIVGPIGSGKSSLMWAMLGEIQQISGSVAMK